ncbi:hypothetical protein [Lysinibacillus sp. LZ02]|uniref:hypothetical protein n=1 Tax=Lysinibacillus sp. LZ02 TaxID=3420668 RepID=UPI003D35A130
MNSKKTVVIVVIILLFIAVSISLIKKDIWEVNAELLKDEVLSIEQSVETVNLTDITPFEWDVAYSFDPYTTKDTIYETVGYKWGNISETVNEGMNQIVFMRDGKVVCYLYGYPENNGYSIYFTGENGTEVTSASMLNADEDVTFQVDRSDHVIYLKND